LRRLIEIVRVQGAGSLVYVDESGFELSSYRPHGWARHANKVFGNRMGGYRKRTSLLLAKCGSVHFAPMLYEGTCNTDLFNAWLKQMLVPALKAGQTVIMDNASFHKSEKTRMLIEQAVCQLLFLPPYSPDFNPIEKTFGWLKRKRQFLSNPLSIDQLIRQYI